MQEQHSPPSVPLLSLQWSVWISLRGGCALLRMYIHAVHVVTTPLLVREGMDRGSSLLFCSRTKAVERPPGQGRVMDKVSEHMLSRLAQWHAPLTPEGVTDVHGSDGGATCVLCHREGGRASEKICVGGGGYCAHTCVGHRVTEEVLEKDFQLCNEQQW
jgi:hypothetical protein